MEFSPDELRILIRALEAMRDEALPSPRTLARDRKRTIALIARAKAARGASGKPRRGEWWSSTV